MSSEYIHFSSQESVSLQKALLTSELQILKASKNLSEYKKLRDEEHVIKIKVKSILDSIKQELIVLDKTLPKIAMPKEHHEKPIQQQIKEKLVKEIPQTHDDMIESELKAIQDKLARLR
ncbi:MAG: hypothetical protein AABW80_00290 [Nanoarchaeota archaeon]